MHKGLGILQTWSFTTRGLFFFFFAFLEPHVRHLDRLGVELELQLPATITTPTTAHQM